MAKRALKKAEDIEKVPLDQSIDLDLSEDPVVPIEPDVKAEQKKPVEVPVQVAPQEEDDGRAALQKQVDDLRKAEKTARDRAAEFERQVQEANRRAQELTEQNSQH